MQGQTERQAAQTAQIEGALSGLHMQRSELQSQLGQIRARRNQLDEQRHVASPAQRPAIEARIAELDARSARLDRELESLNDQIAALLARRTAVAAGQDAAQGIGQGVGQGPQVIRIPQISIPPMDFGGRQRNADMRQIGGIMAAEAVALVLIGVVFWRMGMKRMREQIDRMFASQSQQMNQLQQAVDTVAIEVERISEGQRYVAKVLSEGAPAHALPGGRKEQSPNRQG